MTTNKDKINESLEIILKESQNENVKKFALLCYKDKEEMIAILSLTVMLCRLWPGTFIELTRQVCLPGDAVGAVDSLN